MNVPEVGMDDPNLGTYLDEGGEPIYPFIPLEYPDPRLAMVAEEVEPSDEARKLLTRMNLTVMRHRAAGLAATQIGWNARAVVVHNPTTGEFWSMLNPRITKRSPFKFNSHEGCLSCPGKTVTVKRSCKVTVEGVDGRGEPMSVTADGIMAAAWQHEIDHLDGITIADREQPRKKRPLRAA